LIPQQLYNKMMFTKFPSRASGRDVKILFITLFRLFKPENFVKMIALWKGKKPFSVLQYLFSRRLHLTAFACLTLPETARFT